MTEDTDRRITVRYRRLEATAQYCSVEFEAIASIPLSEAESIPGAIAGLRIELEDQVSRAVVQAKARRREEEAGLRRPTAAGVVESPAPPAKKETGLPF